MRDKEEGKRVPEIGGWPDRLAPIAVIIAAVLTTAGFLDAFFLVPPVPGASVSEPASIGGVLIQNKLLISQKIFFFHMPVAMVSFCALAFAGYYSIRFVLMTMATGEMWTRFEWGVWWTWDPRLTTYLILMLIVIAYMVLRSMVDDAERRGVFSAVLAIIAVVDVPICLMITRLIPSSVHPVVVREGGMSPEMGICVGMIMVGMLALGFALYRARFRQVLLSQRAEAIKEKMDEGSSLGSEVMK